MLFHKGVVLSFRATLTHFRFTLLSLLNCIQSTLWKCLLLKTSWSDVRVVFHFPLTSTIPHLTQLCLHLGKTLPPRGRPLPRIHSRAHHHHRRFRPLPLVFKRGIFCARPSDAKSSRSLLASNSEDDEGEESLTAST